MSWTQISCYKTEMIMLPNPYIIKANTFDEDCVVYKPSTLGREKWNDEYCKHQGPSICEKPAL